MVWPGLVASQEPTSSKQTKRRTRDRVLHEDLEE